MFRDAPHPTELIRLAQRENTGFVQGCTVHQDTPTAAAIADTARPERITASTTRSRS